MSTATGGPQNESGWAGIVQAIGPLKTLAAGDSSTPASSRRFLIVTDLKDSSHVVLRQASGSSGQ